MIEYCVDLRLPDFPHRAGAVSTASRPRHPSGGDAATIDGFDRSKAAATPFGEVTVWAAER
ncbi:hypothetical protein [Streptomyces zaomyceticus]|uniref:hypothetical protein n=1 Tax=Streptomyces zaomyceticus TaxID=68286 RepID=UPI002E10EF28|nr:hypothetical protein OG237_40445 [Streptomyces zaomyceticus]